LNRGCSASSRNGKLISLRSSTFASKLACFDAMDVNQSAMGFPARPGRVDPMMMPRTCFASVHRPARFNNHSHAKEELFDYIEVFYNQQRRHSALDYVSPAEYERAARLRQAA
jgi:transposase InsO family protein